MAPYPRLYISLIILLSSVVGCSRTTYRVSHWVTSGGVEVQSNFMVGCPPDVLDKVCQRHVRSAQIWLLPYMPAAFVVQNIENLPPDQRRPLYILSSPLFLFSAILDLTCLPLALLWGGATGLYDLVDPPPPGKDWSRERFGE